MSRSPRHNQHPLVGAQRLAVTVQAEGPFPLTPALSPEEREIVRSAGNSSPFSERSRPADRYSLSSGERARVRGNSTPDCIHTALGYSNPNSGCRVSKSQRPPPLSRSCSLKAALLSRSRLLVLMAGLGCVISGRALDLSNAVVVCSPDASPRQKQAVKMLVEEAEKRTRIRWPQMTTWPATNVPVIAVGLKSAVRDFAEPYAEGLQSPSTPSPAEG
jgi:hypothetical protein